jgi:flagellar M-ring protein FliF
VGSLVETLRRLGPVKLAMMAVVAAALIASFTFFASRINQPPMGLLFSELSAQDSGQIISKLETQNVPYELRAGGSQIYVPSDRVLRLRMSFAEAGVPRGGTIGYEIFDRGEAIGATNFVQTLNHVRALEGELSRTIGSIAPISNARVHLVIPRRDLFSRDRQDPTASVVLRLREAGTLPRSQVNAIQHLVASSVAGLKPARVSVIDDRGNLLARGQAEGEDNSPTATAASAEERRRTYEQRLARTIEELLERSVGAGKVRAEVTAEMDFDRIITNTESFDPDGQVVRSTQTVTESSDAKEASSSNAVSVTANLPDGDSASQPGQNSNRTQRSEETVNYEITKTIKNHIREAGAVRRLSVAVLVDGVTTVNSDGTRSYAARSAEDIERLTALAKSAIGFNQQRGDSLELANLAFAGVEPLDPGAPAPFLNLSRSEYFQIAWILVSALLGILVVLFFLRPIASGFYEAATAEQPVPAGAGGGVPLLPGRTGAAQAALAPPAGGGLPDVPDAEGAAAAADAMIDLDRVEGRVKASSMKKIGEIVEKHPEEAVAIVRSWMYQEN